MGRIDESSFGGTNEDDDATADPEEINVAGEGPPDRVGRTPNADGRFLVTRLLVLLGKLLVVDLVEKIPLFTAAADKLLVVDCSEVSLAKETLKWGGFLVLTVTSVWEEPSC